MSKELEFPKNAYHDPNTGMFVSPEPEVSDAEFQHMDIGEKGLWLPKPAYKPMRMIQFAQPHAFLEVTESTDAIMAMINDARNNTEPEWFNFIEPVYGARVAVPRHVLAEARWVMEGFKDMDMVKEQMAAAEYQKQQMQLGRLQAKRRG